MSRSLSLCKGKGSLTHNNRIFQPDNADPNRKDLNVTYKTQTLDDAYKECFGGAVDDFNATQAREDRKIDNYYEHLFNNQPKHIVATGSKGRKSFYEELVQIGTMHDSGCGTPDGELASKCLDEYMQGWQERNPQLHVFNAVLHLDEATPHLHIDYIPVATDYKRGLAVQTGLNKAIEQMGYQNVDKNNTAFMAWRESERQVLTDICHARGIQIADKKPSRGISLTPDEYKSQKDSEISAIEQRVTDAKAELEPLRLLKKDMKAVENPEVYEFGIRKKDKYVKLADYEKVAESNVRHIANREKIKQIGDNISIKETKLDKFASELDEREVDLGDRARMIDERNIESKKRESDSISKMLEAETKYAEVEQLYNQQVNLNYEAKELRAENEVLKKEIPPLRDEVTSLRAQVANFPAKLAEAVKPFKEQLNDAWTTCKNVLQGVGLLLWDNGKYKANLTKEQDRLIKAVCNYGSKWAEHDGFPEVAVDIRNRVGISGDLQKEIKALESKVRGYER